VSGPSEQVNLVDHDPDWAGSFETERAVLGELFDGRVVAIEHVGSTSVPGLCAKPIVDVMIGLRQLELSEKEIAAMARLGYEYKGEHRPGRLLFVKQPRTHHVHVVEHGSEAWDRQLAFRDVLRSDAVERERYDALKRRLAAEGHPLEAYGELKTPFIREVEARARAHRARRMD
jgi:GrpB-like predicted nucleotidyltransferase (UPF0157 family)